MEATETIQKVNELVSVLTDDQKQLLKDTINMGFWGDTDMEFRNENDEVEFKRYKDLMLDTTYTNIKGNKVDEVGSKPIYSYTVQPVIRVDFSKFIKKEEVKDASEVIYEVYKRLKKDDNLTSIISYVKTYLGEE